MNTRRIIICFSIMIISLGSFAQKTRTTYFTLGDCANGDTIFVENIKIARELVPTDLAMNMQIKNVDVTIKTGAKPSIMWMKSAELHQGIVKVFSKLKPGNTILMDVTVINKTTNKELKLPTHIYHLK
jgi:hypothetical protein